MKLTLEQLQELFPGGKLDHRGKNLIAQCPQCGQWEFGISIDENHQFGCYRRKKCGYTGNIFTLIKLWKRFDLLSRNGNVFKNGQVENRIIKRQAEEELVLDLPDIRMPIGWKRLYQDEYLDSREFTEYNRYEVGRTNIDPRVSKDYIVIAVKEEGKLKGFIGRHYRSKKELDKINERRKEQGLRIIPRYRNSVSTDFAKLIFGYDEIEKETDTIICVEGVFDKWNIDKLLDLHLQKEIKCNATFKCDISPEQRYKWQKKGIKNLILLYDPDVIDKIKKNAIELQEYFNVQVGFSKSGKDPGDMKIYDLSEVIENLESPSQFRLSKVNIRTLTKKI